MKQVTHKLISTKQLASLIRGGKRVRAVYDWKNKKFISPEQIVDGKGPGHSDMWAFDGVFWAASLDELFEIGLTSDCDVFLRWNDNTERCNLKQSSEIQRFLKTHEYDVVIQLLRGYDDSFKRRSELYITTTKDFLDLIQRATTLKQPLVFADGSGSVASVAILFGKQIRRPLFKKYLTLMDEDITS